MSQNISAQQAENPVFSVVIPFHNCEEQLDTCLKSLMAQTFKDFEVLAVNDASTDGTAHAAERAVRAGLPLTLLETPENVGPGAARNLALKQARGTYVYCLDADDYVRPTMLARVKEAFEKTGADMVLFGFDTLNDQVESEFEADWALRNADVYPAFPQGSFTWKTAPDLFFETVQNVPWNKALRKRILDENGIAFQQLFLSEDLMYSLPAACLSENIVRVNESLMVHREFSGTNAMSSKTRYPLDFLQAFATLKQWLSARGMYGQLRRAYQNWLLDAVYYNMPTYADYDGFKEAYAILTSENLQAFDLADLDSQGVRDHRYRKMLEALQACASHEGGAGRFALALANIEAAEVQEQKCGFQNDSTSAKWLLGKAKRRLLRK